MRALLIVKTSSMGDVIQYLPAVTDLRAHFPELAIDWLVEAPFAPLAGLHPAVREVIPVKLRSWRKQLFQRTTWLEYSALRRKLARTAYDGVLDAQGLLKSALLARLARAPLSGYAAHSAREPLSSLFYQHRFGIGWDQHAVQRNRALTAAAYGYCVDGPTDYGIPPPPLPADAWRTHAPYVMLLTATARAEKLWPEAHWIALGQALAAQGLLCALPAGSPFERARAARIAAQIPRAQCLPPMALDTMAAVLAHARGAVGVDTGLSHLAAALGVPIVAIYVATEPGANGVAGGPLAHNLGGRGQCPSAAAVLGALTPLLAARAA